MDTSRTLSLSVKPVCPGLQSATQVMVSDMTLQSSRLDKKALHWRNVRRDVTTKTSAWIEMSKQKNLSSTLGQLLLYIHIEPISQRSVTLEGSGVSYRWRPNIGRTWSQGLPFGACRCKKEFQMYVVFCFLTLHAQSTVTTGCVYETVSTLASTVPIRMTWMQSLPTLNAHHSLYS